MKTFKLNILQTFILIFTVCILVTSCFNDKSEIQVEETLTEENLIENLNTKTNRKAIQDLFSNDKSVSQIIQELNTSNNIVTSSANQEVDGIISGNLNLAEIDFNLLLDEYSECSDCPDEYKDFLIPFFEEIIKTDDNLVLNKIEEYESLIDSLELDEVHRENLKFTLFSFKEATEYALDYHEFETSSFTFSTSNGEDSAGKKIGRGLAWGFLTGCATGAYIGATVGTVTVPILGTAVGAVAGCIYGGAFSGTVSAIGAGFWAAVDAIF